jgi:hypothetical protein
MFEKTLYYAVNRSGQGCIFMEEPRRDTVLERWVGEYHPCVTLTIDLMEMLGFVLPILSWPDEPVRLKLTLEHEA